MAAYRRLEVTGNQGEHHDVTVVGFADDAILDEAGIQELGDELLQLVDEQNRGKLVLDFSKCGALSSTLLGKLVLFDKKVKARGGKLKLCRVRPEFYNIFAIAKFNTLFDIKADETEAVQSF